MDMLLGLIAIHSAIRVYKPCRDGLRDRLLFLSAAAVCRVKRLRPFLFLFFSLFFFVLEGKIFITQVQQYEPPENVTSTANQKLQANITLCMGQPYGPMHVTSLHAGRHGDRSSSTALVWGKHPLWTDRLLALWLGRCSYALCV